MYDAKRLFIILIFMRRISVMQRRIKFMNNFRVIELL